MSLIVIAVLFLLSGIYQAIDVCVSLAHSKLSFNFGVLGIFVCFGLLRFSSGWRICALIFIWFGIVAALVFGVILLRNQSPVPVSFFGHTFGFSSPALALFAAFLFLISYGWQYRVLTREDVVRLFHD